MNPLLNLSFYTNIPTPYQDDFFTELGKVCNFNAVFYATSEKDRNWELEKVSYSRTFIQNSIIAKILQNKFKDFHFSWSIFKIAFNDRADWIILGGNYLALNNLIAAIILKLRGKNIAFYSEPINLEGSLKKILKKLYLSIFTLFCDKIIGIGKRAELSYRNLGFNKMNYLNIPYSINVDFFNKDNIHLAELEEIKINLNLSNRFIILSSGSLIPRKGMDLVIKVINALDSKYPNQIAGLIIGSGYQLKELQDLDEKNLVRFCGFKTKNEIPYYFNLSDVFLFCSRYDGWGLVINEAIATELPIICSDKVGSSEWIANQENGFIYTDENIDTLVSLVEQLYLNSELRSKMKYQNSLLKKFVSSSSFARILVEELTKAEK